MTTKTNESKTPCLCGCGRYPKKDKSRWVPGHDLRDLVRRNKEAGR